MMDLMRYLPDYYEKSRLMRSIQEAIGAEIPDANYLWQIFFISTCPDEYLWLWEEELGEQGGREALLAKMRGTGLLNLELAQSTGIGLFEPHKLSPEEGYILSGNEAMFPDGIYYAPLITDVIVTPDKLQLARKLVDNTKASGFNYWFGVKLSEIVAAPDVIHNHGLSIYTPCIIPSPDDYVSGPKTTHPLDLDIQYQLSAKTPESQGRAVNTANYNEELFKVTELGGLELVQNPEEYQVEDILLDDDANFAELLAHIFGTGPAVIPAESYMWPGYSYKASAPEATIAEERTINITAAVDCARNHWSPAVSFLDKSVTFLDTAINAQTSNIKVEVG